MNSARAAFAALASSTQDDWNDWAESNVAWPIQGSPRYVDGETYFANMYIVEELFSGSTPSPSVPTELPTWQSRPKFFEFATWESGTYTVTAETDFEYGTELIFSGVPPSKTVFDGNWYGEKIIGADTLYSGLAENDQYSGIDSMMTSTFGAISTSDKVWGRVWEKYPSTGFVRVIKDPCTPNPTDAPATNTLDVELTNGRTPEIEQCTVTALTVTYSDIGSTVFYDLGGGQTGYQTITLSTGYDRDDIEFMKIETYWNDYQYDLYGTSWDGSNPWEWTAELT